MMRFNVKVKESIGRVIGSYFTTNEITNIFANANITTDETLYAKWRITLNAFSKLSTEEGFFNIIEQFCHPLNFENTQVEDARINFIENLNKILSYEDIEIVPTEKNVAIISKGKSVYESSQFESPAKTSTDYIVEVLNYFKNEYNKAKLAGIVYEYNLGPNFSLSNYEPEPDEINHAYFRAQAIEQLHKIGFIKKYSIENKVVDGYGMAVDDFAICEIDESKITQKEAPRATDAGVEAMIQKVVHEHTHKFENSIQEKDIVLNHKYEKGAGAGFYIIKKGDDFIYKGKTLNLSKNTDYYKTFCALYAKLPNGGEIKYKEFIEEIKSRITKVKSKNEEEMRKFIQTNLTDKSNGFIRYAEIPDTEDNGKPLIEIIRGSGIRFNNKAG